MTGGTTFRKNVYKWFMLSGDDKYLTNHNLNEDSIVFEVGGYTGVFSDVIIQKYNCFMYIFEPVQEFYDILVKKYHNNPKIKVYHFGLSNKNEQLSISKSDDGSSVFKKAGQNEVIQLLDFTTFIKQENFINKNIDLLSINIEGGEYNLLHDVLNKHSHMIQSIQIQFHDFIPDADQKREYILSLLEKENYKKGYSFPFVWEFFTKK